MIPLCESVSRYSDLRLIRLSILALLDRWVILVVSNYQTESPA